MDLILTVIECPTYSNLLNHTKVFGPAGGMIGRAEACDWVLTDSERIVSSRHFEVRYTNDSFIIIDHSTNGTFINESPNPLGGGASHQLKSGDVIVCGEYHLSALLKAREKIEMPTDLGSVDFLDSADRTTFNAGMAEKKDSLDAARDLESWLAPVASKPAPSEQWGGSRSEDFSFFQQSNESDPLKALDKSGHMTSSAHLSGMKDDCWESGGSFSDQASLVQQSMQTPQFKESPSIDELLGLSDTSDALSPIEKIEANPVVAGSIAASSVAVQLQADVKSQSADSVDLIEVLMKELGLESLPPSQKDSLVKDVSSMLNETVAKLIDLLRARTTIKNELRVQHTLIQSSHNNPLKFSGNATEAIRLLFGGVASSFMSPVEAIRDGFDDLSDHQLAVLKSMQKSYEHMLNQFDPYEMSYTLNTSASLWGGGDAKKWKAYEQYYSSLKADYEATYSRLFGEVFAKEYEKILADLKNRRMMGGSGI